MTKESHGIPWAEMPRVLQNSFITDGDSWYVTGVEEVETLDSIFPLEKRVYLHADGSWQRIAHYFATSDAALAALESAPSRIESPSGDAITDFELSLNDSRSWKRRKR